MREITVAQRDTIKGQIVKDANGNRRYKVDPEKLKNGKYMVNDSVYDDMVTAGKLPSGISPKTITQSDMEWDNHTDPPS